jgi:hypothetical protein
MQDSVHTPKVLEGEVQLEAVGPKVTIELLA